MLSCCCFCSGKFKSLALSTYPVFLCFLHCLLSPHVCFPVLFCSVCLISFLFQIFPLVTEVENISDDPWLFPATSLSMYLTGCISHCCIVSGNHRIDVHVLISQSIEWCDFPSNCQPHLGPSAFQVQTLVMAVPPSSDELERPSSLGHNHFLCLLH